MKNRSNQCSKKLLVGIFIALFVGNLSANSSIFANPEKFKRELDEIIDLKKNPNLTWEQCVDRICECIESDKNCKKGNPLDSFKQTLEQAKKVRDLAKIKKMLEPHTAFLTNEFKAIYPGKFCGIPKEAIGARDRFNAALPVRLEKSMKA